MKKIVLSLSLILAVAVPALGSANERILPDVGQITSGSHLEVIRRGSNCEVKWVADNPEIYNLQKLKTGVYETYFNDNTNTVYVKRDGEIITEAKI